MAVRLSPRSPPCIILALSGMSAQSEGGGGGGVLFYNTARRGLLALPRVLFQGVVLGDPSLWQLLIITCAGE